MAERDEEQRELITAVDRLNDQIDKLDKSSQSNTKSIDNLNKQVEKETRRASTAATKAKTGLDVGGSSLRLATESLRFNQARKTLKAGAETKSIKSTLGTVVKLAAKLSPRLKIALVVLGALGAMKVFKGRGGKGGGAGGASSFSEQEKQTAILAALLRTSLKNNENLATVYGRARAAQDPFNRTPSFFRNDRNAPTAAQVTSAAALVASQNELKAAQSAFARTIGQISAPYKELANIIKARVISEVTPAAAAAGPIGRSSLLGFGAFSGLATGDALLRMMMGRAPATQPRRGGFLGGEAERDLFKLQTRGPGSIIGAPPTAQAGTAGGYAVRVQLQRQSLQTQVTKQWQDDVLKAMKELVALNLLQPDDLYRKRVEFGRPGI